MSSTLRHHSVILRWKSLTHSVWVFTVRDALGIMLDVLTAEASSLVQSTSWRLQGCGGKKKWSRCHWKSVQGVSTQDNFSLSLACMYWNESVNTVEDRSGSWKKKKSLLVSVKKQCTNLGQCFPCRNQHTIQSVYWIKVDYFQVQQRCYEILVTALVSFPTR